MYDVVPVKRLSKIRVRCVTGTAAVQTRRKGEPDHTGSVERSETKDRSVVFPVDGRTETGSGLVLAPEPCGHFDRRMRADCIAPRRLGVRGVEFF
jgi:hypothetical protein